MSEYQMSRRQRPGRTGRALLTGASSLALVLGLATAVHAQGSGPVQLQAPTPSGAGTQGAQTAPSDASAQPSVQLPPSPGALLSDPMIPERDMTSIYGDAEVGSGQYSDIEIRLLRQARFWEERFNREASIEVLEKILAINPRNDRALYHIGRHEAQRGKIEEARRYLQRLRDVRADETTIAQLQTTIRLYQNQGRLLNEARSLAQSGQTPEALAQYRAIFDGQDPSGEVAIEFFHTLAGEGGDWESAVAGLQREVNRDPGNRTADYTLAEVLTYKEATRREGLDRLRRFSADPAFAERAARSYRNALLWMDATLDDRALYEEYLTTFPEDAEMQTKFSQLTAPPVLANASPIVNEAYRALYADELEKAEGLLNDALRQNPNDADALAAMGIIHLRQSRFAQSENAFARAIEIDPAVRERVDESYRSASFWRRYNEAIASRDGGNLQTAERMLVEIRDMDVPDSQWADIALADTYVRMNRLDRAEELYRGVLQADDDNAPAVMGLVTIYQRRGRLDEALQFGRKLSAADRREMGLSRLEAQRMRVRAERAIKRGQTATARRELEAAVRRMPNDPWLRLDYASLLLNTGNRATADAQMADLAQRNPNGVETRQALAVYRSRVGDWAEVSRLIESLPRSARDAGMRKLLAEAQFAQALESIKTAARRGDRERAIGMISDLQAKHGGNPERSVMIADAYMIAGDTPRAVTLVRAAMEKSKQLSVASMIRIAEILGEAGNRGEANRILASLRNRRDVPANFDEQLERVRRANILARARAEMNQGDPETAFESITPLLTANPRDGETLRLAGEIHLYSEHEETAYEYFARAISVNPEDQFSIRGAVGAALKIGDVDAASRLLEAAIARMPNEPEMYFLAADIAQAAGNKQATREALEIAQRLQSQDVIEQGPALGRRTPGLERPILRRGPNRPGTLDDEASLTVPSTTQHAVLGWHDSIRARLTENGWSADLLVAAAASDMGASTALRSSSYDGEQISQMAAVLDNDRQRSAGEIYQLAQAENQYEADRIRRMLRGISEGEQNTGEETGRVIPLRTTPLDDDSSAARFTVPRAPRQSTEDRLEDLRWDLDTIASQDVGVRRRPGERGISRLFEVSSHIRGETQIFGGRGYVQATPTFITAGDEATGRSSYRRFGSNAADPDLANAQPEVITDEQSQAGVAIEVGYSRGRFSADLGSTPVGFEVLNFVGGASYDFSMGEDWYLRVDGHRRAVKDSVLSYAGAEDNGDQSNETIPAYAGTGNNFGGVTRSGVSATLLKDFGGAGLYVGGTFDVYKGENVESNNYYELSGGFYFLPINEQDRQLQVGYNTTYFAFDENRSFFTLGHGGYFSPQTFVSASVPIDYTVDKGPLRYKLQGAIGVQYFDEDTEPFFPDSPALQATAAGFLNANERIVHNGEDSLEVAFRLGGEVSYRLGERVEVGAKAQHDDTAGYTETSARLGFKYRFGAD